MGITCGQNYEIINGRKVIKKHVATIHCSNRLSLLERKISNALLYNAYPTLGEELEHVLTIDQLKGLLSITTRNHKVLKNALRKLISTVLEWNVLGDDVPELEGWNSSTILSAVSVQNGVIKYQYSELIKSLLIDPKLYGKINLLIQSRFKSAYALALYENCSRYRGLKYTKKFTVAEFRALMGIEDGKYLVFRDLNRRVIAPAIDEINTCSDIRVDVELGRRGRQVTTICFSLAERKMKRRFTVDKNKNSFATETPLTVDQIKIMKDFNLEEAVIRAFYAEFDASRVEGAASYIRALTGFKMGNIGNLGGYLREAIEKNFQIAGSRRVFGQKSIKKISKAEKVNKLREQYLISYLPLKTYNIFQGVDRDLRQKIYNDFVNNGQSYYGKYANIGIEKGYENILIFSEGFALFIYRCYPEILFSLVSLEDYIEQQFALEDDKKN